MAIQNRRGAYSDFDPTKLMPGEFAVVMEDDPDGADGVAVYMCFGNGIVKRLIGAEDIQDILSVPISLGQGTASIIESEATSANGRSAHAEGRNTTAPGINSHAEGYNTTASGDYGSHSEGQSTTASGGSSHAEGSGSTASGPSSHAENAGTTASGNYSHSEGDHTIAAGTAQHVSGKYNIQDSNNTYAEIIGNGTSNSSRSNARTLDWSGNEVIAGKLTMGAGPTANMDAATKQYVDNAVGGVSQVAFSDPNSDGNIVISFT